MSRIGRESSDYQSLALAIELHGYVWWCGGMVLPHSPQDAIYSRDAGSCRLSLRKNPVVSA